MRRLGMILSVLASINLFCADRSCEPDIDLGLPDIAFALTYVNWAWGHTYRAWYVDWDGVVSEVLTFSKGDSLWAIEEDGFVSLMELARMHELAVQTGQSISPDTLIAKSTLIAPAAAGKVSDPVPGVCVDCGTARYLAFIRDPARGGYRMVLLYQQGDTQRINDSPAAQILYQWISSVAWTFP